MDAPPIGAGDHHQATAVSLRPPASRSLARASGVERAAPATRCREGINPFAEFVSVARMLTVRGQHTAPTVRGEIDRSNTVTELLRLGSIDLWPPSSNARSQARERFSLPDNETSH
jgi:hypothetical protein